MAYSYKVQFPRWFWLVLPLLALPICLPILLLIHDPHLMPPLNSLNPLFIFLIFLISIGFRMSSRIEVDPEGVRFVTPLAVASARDFKWADVSNIVREPLIIFGRNYGHLYRVQLRNRRVVTLSDGQGRNGSRLQPTGLGMPEFAEALQRLSPVPLGESQGMDPATQELGKEAGQVAAVGLILAVFTLLTLLMARGAHFADVPWGGYYMKGCALAAALAALYYQRNIPGKVALPFTTLLAAGTVFFLSATLPLATFSFLPAHTETFVAVDENKQSLSLNGVSETAVHIEIESFMHQRLVHQGQRIDLAVQGGLLGVYVIPGDQYRRLIDDHRPVPAEDRQDEAGDDKKVEMGIIPGGAVK